MGVLGDGGNRNHNSSRENNVSVDLSEVETQQIDSQCFPGGAAEDDGPNDLWYLPDTMAVDDTQPLEDPFETQLVNLEGETQLLDLACETQVVDDLDCMKNMSMDFLDDLIVDVDGGGCDEANEIEKLCETQVIFPDDSNEIDDGHDTVELVDTMDNYHPKQSDNARGASSDACVNEEHYSVDGGHDTVELVDTMDNYHPKQSDNARGASSDACVNEEHYSDGGHDTVELVDTMDNYHPKQSDNARGASSDACVNEEHYSGSVSKGFTSIRAASVRSSGLAARANGGLFTSGNDKTSPEQKIEKENSSLVGSSLESGRYLLNKNNEISEKQKNSNKCKVGSTAMRKLFREDDDADLVQSDDDNKHTYDNPDMLDEFPTYENCLAGLSYANSQEPGELSQAHALEMVDKFLDLNALELEEGLGTTVCGGKKPNVISGVKGSLKLAKSSFHKSTDGECGIYDWDITREDEGGGEFFRNKKELFFDKGGSKKRSATEPMKPRHAGSVDALGNSVERTEQKCTKSKSGDTIYSDSRLMLHNLRARGKSLNGGEVFHKNIVKNLDEQLKRVSGHELVENDKRKDASDMNNIGPDTQMAAEAMETLCFEVHLDDSNDSACNKGTYDQAKGNRKSNRTTPLEACLTTKKAHSTSVSVTKKKRTSSISTCNESSLSPRQFKKISKKYDSVLGEAEQRELPEMESTGQGSAANIHSKERHESSIAHRTRKCTELNRSKAAANSYDAKEDMNDPMSTPVLRKKRTTGKHRNVKIVTIEQVKQIGLAALNRSNYSCVGTSSALNTESVGKQKGKRSRQDTLPVGQDADTQHGKKFKRPIEVEQSGAETSAEGAKTNGSIETTPREKSGTPTSACRVPVTCGTPENNVSPICMGDEYQKQSCRKNLARLSLMKEINSLVTASPGPYGRTKDLRKRKDITQIKVLFSQHLDDDVVNKQKKILSRLGGGVACSMSDATHFVADEFVRTRNMLEAIASGKPVVTHLWLKSCGQANCLIDEKNYVLRDARKEREFGFSLPVSLSRAFQHPLLQGQKVLITPNTKPGKDILANLVKAVHGLPIERLGRSVLKDEKLPDDLLILSCEEDYDICVPFLKKDGAIYSSELLLNGIVKQKLEYERHRLFADHVKKTRSTIWVKNKSQYLPVTKCR